jgi:hypothetical protein
MTYRPRGMTSTVEAFPWNRHASDAALVAFVGAENVRGLDRPSGSRTVFHPLAGWQPVQWNDWLVRGRSGAVLVVPAYVFSQTYEREPFPLSARGGV